jgi:hypothetical protein
MTHDHRTSTIHQADLDREIEMLRNERLLADTGDGSGWARRVRRAAGRQLIAAGTALIGGERRQLRTHRA